MCCETPQKFASSKRLSLYASQAEAAQLVGRPISLASPSQLSMALYTDLRLPPPPDRAGRSSPVQHLFLGLRISGTCYYE